MAEPEAQRRGDSADEKLYTLSEISQKTNISMPTLQRYKKMYQDRIPSVGQGRKQRYPDSALPVFDEIKTENAGKRGRPRKDASAPRPARPAASKRGAGRAAKAAPAGRRGRKAAGAAATAPRGAAAKRAGGRKAAGSGRGPGRPAKKSSGAGSGNLLTLTQISETTGISYPTLVRYVRMHADRLPSEGKGRARRFYPQAVDVFRQLRSESGRGGRKKGSGAAKKAASGRRPGRPAGRPAASSSEGSGVIAQRLKQIEKAQQNLEKRFKGFVDSLQKLFR
jgi:predicted DNA-binding transcriptional regulator AlpA